MEKKSEDKQKFENMYGVDKVKLIINKYTKEEKSSKTVGEEVGISATQIRRILAANGIEGKSLKTDDLLEKQIIEMYQNGKSFEQIARDLGNIVPSTASRIIKRNNIQQKPFFEARQTYNINNHFFSNINTEENAYFLGFLYADGNVDKNGSAITLCLHQQDSDVLYKFMNCLYNGKKPELIIVRDIYRTFTISNIQIREDLIKHGCVPNKTFNIRMPTTFDNVVLMKHFIRGLFDGDGFIAITKDKNFKRVVIGLTGFIDLLQGVSDFFKKELSIDCHLYKENRANEGIYNLSFSKQEDCIKYLKWVYNDANIYLDRKYEKHTEALKLLGEQIEKSNTYLPDTLLSYKGNKLSAKHVSSIPIEQKKEISEYLFNFFRKIGFPYDRESEENLKLDFYKLCNFNGKIENLEIKFAPECGNSIMKPFYKHFFDVVGEKNKKSMMQAFNDDELLKSVIDNRLGITYKETFNITGNMIRQGIRNSFAGFAASVFKPSIAKTIYDHFCDDSTVLDISAGFGQRLLGAAASTKVKKYIGIDPWSLQIESANKMIEFFKIQKAEMHQIGSEKFCPEELFEQIDFVFSSPPFYNKEIYCQEETQAYQNKSFAMFIECWWIKTAENVYKMLKNDGVFVVNMSQKFMNLMLCATNHLFKLEEIFSISFQRKHLGSGQDSQDVFYVLKKI
jgi:tRNA1(Val) A37 N6-methylase TrmN6